MSTFSRDNGPCEGGFDFAWFRNQIKQLDYDVTLLKNILPSGRFESTETGTVDGHIKAVQGNTTRTVADMNTAISALDSAVTTKALTVTGYLETDATKGAVVVSSKLAAKDITADNITAGPSFNISEVSKPSGSVSIDNVVYQVLGKLKRVRKTDTEVPSATLPATIYVYNDTDPKLSAIVQATEGGLAVLHNVRTYKCKVKETTENPDPKDTDEDALKATYCVFRTVDTESNIQFYVGLRLTKSDDTSIVSSLRVAMINADPVETVSGSIYKIVKSVSTEKYVSFLSTDFDFTDITATNIKTSSVTTGSVTVKNGTNATTAAIDQNGAISGASVAVTDLTATGASNLASVSMSGNLGVGGSASVTGATTVDGAFTATVGTKTPNVTELGGNELISFKKDSNSPRGTVTVGGEFNTVELIGRDARPKYTTVEGADTVTADIALTRDLASSIVYKGLFQFFTDQNPDSEEKWSDDTYKGVIPPINTSPDGKYTYDIKVDDWCVQIAAPNYDTLQFWKYTSNKNWTKVAAPEGFGDLTPAHNQAWQFHIDWVKEHDDKSKDTYYHEAEVIWNPENARLERVSIINLPLEDYYTKEEVDARIDTYDILATAQCDWFDRRKQITDTLGRTVDNPAYIRNKPLVGLSVLDGGTWGATTSDRQEYPQWIVDGGEFNQLGTCVGTYQTRALLPTTADPTWHTGDYAYVETDETGSGAKTRFKIADIGTITQVIDWQRDITVTDLGEFRKDVIFKIWSGEKAFLPPATDKTVRTLKWCMDTEQLYIDTGDVSKGENGNKLLNNPNESFVDAVKQVLDGVRARDNYKTQLKTVITPNGLADIVFTVQSKTGDDRVGFEDKGGNVFEISVDVADLKKMLDKGSVIQAVAESKDQNNIAYGSLKWSTIASPGTLTNPDPATPTVAGLALKAGSNCFLDRTDNFSIDGIDYYLLTLGLDGATAQAVANDYIVRTAATNYDSSKVELTLTSNSLMNSIPTTVTKKLEIRPGTGVALSTTGSTTDAAVAILGIDTTTMGYFDNAIVTDETFDITSQYGARVTVQKDTLKKAGPAVSTSLALKPGSNITIAADPASTPENKIALVGLAPAVTTSLVASRLSIVDMANTGMTFTSAPILGTSPPATTKSYSIVAGDNITVAGLTVNDVTTVTVGLDSSVVAALQTSYIQNISPSTATGLALTVTSQAIQNGTPSTHTIKLLPGDGITMVPTAGSTPTDPEVTINAVSALLPAYTNLSLTIPSGEMTCSIYYLRKQNWVHAQVNLTMTLGNTQQGTFTQQLPQDVRPLIPIVITEMGESGYRKLTLQPNGNVDYYFDIRGAIDTSIMYFVQGV